MAKVIIISQIAKQRLHFNALFNIFLLLTYYLTILLAYTLFPPTGTILRFRLTD